MYKTSLTVLLVFLAVFLLTPRTTSAQDPDFYIYLCFGQSNMEGQGTIETRDRTVDSRFQVMESVDCSNLGRIKGNWYAAVPPLCRCWSGLSPADYFGRTMIENLPDSIRVGVINVSVAGCKIELFDKDNYQAYVATITEDWLKNIISTYNGNPYQYLVDIAKLAQQDGVIKGILLHQGESNTGDTQWPSKVKGIYDNLVTDLGLNADSIPLLAGEVVNADQGGVCASMNSIIAKLPQTLPNSYVISSSGCTDASDNVHFNSAGYRKIGMRYAIQMLSLMGIEATEPVEPVYPENTDAHFLEAECAPVIGESWEISSDSAASNDHYIAIPAGLQSLAGPSGEEGLLEFPFTVDTSAIYKIYGRVYCPNPDHDSYWIKMDNGEFSLINGIITVNEWNWKILNSYNLNKGEHTFYVSYRDNGALLDKLCITNFTDPPVDMGREAESACDIATDTTVTDTTTTDPTGTTLQYHKVPNHGYVLGQNYPNPVHGHTSISFEIPNPSYVSFKVYNMLGIEIEELAGKDFSPGQHILDLDTGKLPGGYYFYRIKTDRYSATRKMVILSD